MEEKKFTVRDILAFDRTRLANERTFLSYVRTCIGCIGAGAAMLKLFEVEWASVMAVILLVAGPLVFVWGLIGYIRTRHQLKQYTPD